MLKLMACLISLSLASEAPFWKAKPKVFERIQNGEVIVSVTNQKVSEASMPKQRMHLSGAGRVSAPCGFAFRTAQNHEELAKLSGYISNAKYDPKTQVMEFTVSAFFHTSTMGVEIKPFERSAASSAEKIPAHIDYRLVSGPMKGLGWNVIFSEIEAKKCEIGVDGEYRYDDFPIPRIFLEFGLEMVLQGMAKRLRSHTEQAYKAVSTFKTAE